MAEPGGSDIEPASFGYSVASLTFSDGTVVPLPSTGVVAIVGPNNSGKSQALRDIAFHVGAGKGNHARHGLAVTRISDSRSGTAESFIAWMERRARIKDGSIAGVGLGIGTGNVREFIRSCWHSPVGLQQLGMAVAVHLDTETRLSAANPCEAYNAIEAPPTSPLQALYESRTLEKKVSRAFANAYHKDLVVNRLGGNRIHLHVGKAPDVSRTGGELSVEYQLKVRELPLLHEQGDGMRSYAACLLFSDVVDYPLVLIDEPETFLHASAARILAQHLVARTIASRRQFFLSVHSGDVIRGLLDSVQQSVTIIRLEREDDVNRAKTLDADLIKQLWADPLLRVSNILDGLFHAHVCLCEADTDVRFYSAVLAADCVQLQRARPDVLFCHCSGKHRMPSVVRALRSIGVPVTVIADIDLLDGEGVLRGLWEALGHDWCVIRDDWRLVSKGVANTRAVPSVSFVREQLEKLLAERSGSLDDDTAKRIRELVKAQGGWQAVKHGGEAALPKGQARQSYESLKRTLHSAGVVLVPVGELEGFLPAIGNKGPAWVNQAIRLDLALSPELAPAREFIRALPFMASHSDDGVAG